MTEHALTQRAFAELMDLSPARISQLAAEGLPVRPDGKIDEADARQWITDNLDPLRREARKPGSVSGEEGEKLISTREQLLRRELDFLNLKYKQRSEELIDRKAAERQVFNRARFERDSWIAWIARTSGELAGKLASDPAATFTALDHAVRKHLQELAEAPWEGLSCE